MVKKIKASLNIVLLVAFIGLLGFITIKYGPAITQLIRHPQKFGQYIHSFGMLGVLVYIGFQVLQIVIAVIPGEFIQIAAGYLYGVFFGTIYITIGTLIGTVIVFYLTRLIGYSLIKLFVQQKDLEKFNFIINNPRAEIALFLLFLIPGIPKDTLTYLAGLTPINAARFFIISIIARFPSIVGSAVIGSNINNKNYTVVIIVSVIAVVLFLVGILMRDKLISRLESLSHKKDLP
jgi:uncharacterized membrane protein YdjX (TVP38/TMEM64 family)